MYNRKNRAGKTNGFGSGVADDAAYDFESGRPTGGNKGPNFNNG